jgi:RHS repeat-associated protein
MKSSASPLFSQTLYYNDSYAGSSACYNGNLSAMSWPVSGDKTRGYTFSYDGLSRLTAAGYLENGTSNTNYSTSYAYDKQGNITALSRRGPTGTTTFGAIDNLSMSYAGSQLIKADDSGVSVSLSASMDFKDGSNAAQEYFYDANGNLTKDLNKGISGITYNLLNLPIKLTIANSSGSATNTYMYSVDGQKLKTVQQWSSTNSKQTDYCGNMIYENGILKRILVDGGYIEGSVYYFYLTDHEGNNRVVANASGTVVQANHYYPFGMPFTEGNTTSSQPYKYNGKELDTERGLNLYDYGARLYDPALARWTTVDPMAEKYYSWNPYNYGTDEPISYIDKDGKDIIIWYEDNYFRFTGNNQNYAPKNKFVQSFIAAYNYDVKNGGGDKLKLAAHIRNHDFNVMETSGASFQTDRYSKPVVLWNSLQGLEITKKIRISPATVLEHEMDHLVKDVMTPIKDYGNYRRTLESGSDSQYDTKEERRVIRGSEVKTAKGNGEFPEGFKRESHSGKPIITPTPISNKKVKIMEGKND